MKTRIIFGIGIVLGIISVGLFFYARTDEQLTVGFTWTPGAEQQYRLSIATEVGVVLPGAPTPQAIVQQVAGTLAMKVFDRGEGRLHVGFQLVQPIYTLNNQPDETLQKALAAPFVVTFDPSGRPVAFRFPEQLAETARIILEETIRTFQMVLPREGSTTWTKTEAHATGSYLARYRVRKDNSVEKTKIRYTQIAMTADDDESAEAAEARIKRSSAIYRISSDIVWLKDAVVHEALALSKGTDLSTESVMRAELENIAISVGQGESALFGAADGEALLSTYSVPMPEADRDEAGGEAVPAAARLTAEAHVAGLIEQLNSGEKSQRIPLLRQIERALRADPELAFWLAEQIEQPGMTGTTDAWLVHLLERSGTVQAQEALVMVMDDPYYRTWNRVRAIVALGGVENPTDEAVAALVLISQNRGDADAVDMANAALLALGSMGKTLAEKDPQRAELIREDLIRMLEGATDPSEAGMVLKAMENMADPALGEVISPYLQDDAPFVRSAAARSLGRLKGVDHIDLLTDQLEVEENRVVRAAIIAGMEDNGAATQRSLTIVNDRVLAETEAGARFHMTRYLGDHLADFPEGKRTLQILALKDPSGRIRTHARSVLRQYAEAAGRGKEW